MAGITLALFLAFAGAGSINAMDAEAREANPDLPVVNYVDPVYRDR